MVVAHDHHAAKLLTKPCRTVAAAEAQHPSGVIFGRHSALPGGIVGISAHMKRLASVCWDWEGSVEVRPRVRDRNQDGFEEREVVSRLCALAVDANCLYPSAEDSLRAVQDGLLRAEEIDDMAEVEKGGIAQRKFLPPYGATYYHRASVVELSVAALFRRGFNGAVGKGAVQEELIAPVDKNTIRELAAQCSTVQ